MKKKFINNLIIALLFFNFNMKCTIANPNKNSIYKKHQKTKNIHNINIFHHKIESQIIENTNIIDESKGNDLLMNAFSFLGVAYKYGSSSPMYGLDCSGFIQYLFKETFNVSLPRTVYELYNTGAIVKKEELKPGDLIFFNTFSNKISHIGIYIGNNQFIHSPRTGKQIEIQNLDHVYWSKRYIVAKRISVNKITKNIINYSKNYGKN